MLSPDADRWIRAGLRDLRRAPEPGPGVLNVAHGHRLVVSGLPGSGKSTLMRRVHPAVGAPLIRIDAEELRRQWARRLPARLPYGVYRPLLRATHYLRLCRALKGRASVVIHDCGATAWVRRLLALDAWRRGHGFHLVLLDVPPSVAREGQRTRGRAVSDAAFARHCRAMARLTADLGRGTRPRGCASVTLLDRAGADALDGIVFRARRPQEPQRPGAGVSEAAVPEPRGWRTPARRRRG